MSSATVRPGCRLLEYNPAKRLTAEEALRHPYFTSGEPPAPCVFPQGFTPRYSSKTARAAPTKKRGSASAAAPAAVVGKGAQRPPGGGRGPLVTGSAQLAAVRAAVPGAAEAARKGGRGKALLGDADSSKRQKR